MDSLSEILLQNSGRGLAYSLDTQTRHKETTPPKSGSVDHSPDPKGVLFSREALQSVLTAAELLALGFEDGNQCRSGQPPHLGVFLSVSRLWLAYTRRQVVHPTDLGH